MRNLPYEKALLQERVNELINIKTKIGQFKLDKGDNLTADEKRLIKIIEGITSSFQDANRTTAELIREVEKK